MGAIFHIMYLCLCFLTETGNITGKQNTKVKEQTSKYLQTLLKVQVTSIQSPRLDEKCSYISA